MEQQTSETPRRVSFRQGEVWVRQAFYLIREQPLTWVIFAAIYGVIQMAIAALPVFGQFLSMVSMPLFAGGFVVLAVRARAGEELQPLDLLPAIKQHWQRLLALGFAYFGLLLALLVVMMLLLFLLFGEQMKSGQMMGHSPFMMPVMMLLLGGAVFVASMSYWFAPAQIVLRDSEPLPAMRLSARAGMQNWGALLYCGLILSVLFVLAMLPFGLGLLLWLPLGFVTVYMAWLDVCGDGLPPSR